ncbi:Outer membrane protein TolC [Tenacibaculum sp. MAR_2009_124]|uniref:TolC family protein n=1 Tax=Tenacibaculum sp. MAR_2009_124 TaxID=1250059 RepID=UPI00089C46C9|nr:TolC family protein [Tenacibaculum sp. MAR_2009_124]SEB77664.1 Outer membrane protein TolC [Tenacibaculum sp. MAR_2009_124]
MKKLILVFCFISSIVFSQDNSNVLSFEEYLGYVKKFHPILKQAQLVSSKGEAKLLKARGAFDPKIEVDYNRKNFKGTEYYNKLNSTFKIPTWYGIEFKANYESNDGVYLNPEFKTPKEGLYSAGVSISLAKGLLTNKRMASLRQAKLYNQQSVQQQKILINKILFKATNTYFKWLKNHQTKKVYTDYLVNAKIRLQSIKRSFESGDKPAVDTLEASINYKNRLLDLEKAKIGYIKSKLEASNYLWLNNDVPLELTDNVVPDNQTVNLIDEVLTSSITDAVDFNIEDHPKLVKLQLKKKSLIINKKLKLNNLLPKVDLQYNFLSSDYRSINSFNNSNYKAGLNVSIPLFLRKERGDLKLAKIKIKEIDFDISSTRINLTNKIDGTVQQINSYKEQYNILSNLVIDYKNLVQSEERKFSLGEGSLFLVNYREVKLIENQLKYINTQYKYFISKSELLKVLNQHTL